MGLKFGLRDILWFVAVAALSIIAVITNFRLATTQEELAQRNDEFNSITAAYDQLYTDFSKFKEDEATYRIYYDRGCKYMEYGLYQEAIACFESAKRIRSSKGLLDKIVKCIKASNEDLLRQIKDADVKAVYSTVSKDDQK